ncbi:BTAD domain-containing putative transcriptional regulator [Rhodococcus sp. NPDC003318]|uniref:BTAD domain-containing putative transcriptional regulator n=1 Tax=Rhodococcus sp. NPDC003318 TaxID=3364503 RepID=UPI00367A143A
MHIRVLGSMDAETEGTTVDLGGPRQRGVLALLLIARGAVVSVDRLIDDLWHGEPPPRALGALQAYVSNLRRALEPERAPRAPATVLISRAPGYCLTLGPDDVDAWRFESLLRAADRVPSAAERRRVLEEAVGLWRGTAHAEFAAHDWAAPEVARLEELRLVAHERLAAAMLDTGDAAAATAEAGTLTRAHPLREESWRLLALGLHAGGRQADALAALRRARGILADELGLDPGPALQQLEADLLAQRMPVVVPPVRVAEPARAAVPRAVVPAPVVPPPPATGFLGREGELESLLAAALSVSDRARVALVTAEAGGGKTELLLRLRVALGDSRVLLGRCPEAEGAPPAWAWVEILRTLAAEVDPGPLAAALAPLLDDVRLTGDDTAPAAQGRFLLHRAVTDYLDLARLDRPLAVFLDDLHRADAETLTLLTRVAETVPVLLVAAYRPDEVTPSLAETLARLAPHTPERIRLAGLGAEDAAALVREVAGVDADREVIEALTERTGGNPFYLRESARLLGSEGELVATSEVPDGVRDVLRRRFARLPEVAVSVLRLIAVIGRQADVDVLLRAVELDENEALDAVEAGVVAGLLDEPDPSTVRFTHALVRDTLLGDLSQIRRARWHLRVAEAVETVHPDDASALAHHFGAALSAGTARRAADHALDAARQAETRFAHDAAAVHYEQALTAMDRLPGGGDVDERVDTLARLGRSHLVNGAAAPARETRDRALSVAEAAGRDDLIVRSLTAWDTPTPWINRPYGMVDVRVVAAIERALTLPDLTDEQRCRLLVILVDEVYGEDDARTEAAGVEAEALARRLGDPTLLGLALNARLALRHGALPADVRAAIGAEMIALGADEDRAAFALIGNYSALQIACARGDFDTGRLHLAHNEALARRYRWKQAQASNSMVHGMLAHAAGDLDAAEEMYVRAHREFLGHGEIDADGILLLALFSLRVTQGRTGELEAVIRALDTAAADVVVDPLTIALVANGRASEAPALRVGLRPVRSDFFHGFLLTQRGIAVAALGSRDEAEHLYPQLLPYSGQLGGADTGSFTMGPVDTVLGDLALLLGRRDDAVTHLTAAAELARRCGCPQWIDAARSRLQVVH